MPRGTSTAPVQGGSRARLVVLNKIDGLWDELKSEDQINAEIDSQVKSCASLLGVPVKDVYSAVQAQFGSLTVSQYNEYSRVWWVVLQSEPAYRQRPADLTRLYVRSGGGDMVPLSALVTASAASPSTSPATGPRGRRSSRTG